MAAAAAPSSKPVPGYCLKGLCRDGTTKVFINVCGHASVGVPQTRSQEPIPDWNFVDVNGIDNLMIPIAVGDVRELKVDKDEATGAGVTGVRKLVVDVVIHDELVRRVVPTHHHFQHFLARISALAVQWVQQEAGLSLIPASVQKMQNVRYKDAPRDKTPADEAEMARRVAAAMEEILKGGGAKPQSASATAEATAAAPGSNAASSSALPPELLISPNAPAPTKAKGPLIVELDGDNKPKPAIKRGFLKNSGGALYGDGGSSEGAIPVDPTSDPLHAIPASLRGKCQVVDMRTDAEKKHRPIPQEQPALQTAHATAASKGAASAFGGGAGPGAGADFLEDLMRIASGGGGGGEGRRADSAGILGGANDPAPPVRTTAQLMKELSLEKATPPVAPAAVPLPPPPSSGAVRVIVEDVTPTEPAPNWGETVEVRDGAVVVSFAAPSGVAKMADLDLEIEERRVVCHVVASGSRVEIPLPRVIDVDSACAKFAKKSGIVTITALIVG